jgi:hypothetical protein
MYPPSTCAVLDLPLVPVGNGPVPSLKSADRSVELHGLAIRRLATRRNTNAPTKAYGHRG